MWVTAQLNYYMPGFDTNSASDEQFAYMYAALEKIRTEEYKMSMQPFVMGRK